MNNGQIAENGIKQPKEKYFILVCAIVSMIILLALRDIRGVGVSKYLFLLITAVASFAMPIDKVIYFISFAMPLYVGLPGNYMTAIFLARFLFDCNKLKFKMSTVITCFLCGAYAIISAFFTGHTSISELMFFPGMILITLIFSIDEKISRSKLVLCYATGVAALGAIMLLNTLNYCDFGDLLNSATRLGVVLIDLNKGVGNMIVNVDPNYYGTFIMPALSVGIMSIYEKSGDQKNTAVNILTVVAIGVSVAVGFVGLSRAFILVLCGWLLLYFVSVKNVKAFFGALAIILVLAIIVAVFMPSVLDALNERFHDSSMATANGRTVVISEFFKLWSANVGTMFFGAGLFDCNVHCMPLQVLFGGGFVFAALFFVYCITLHKPQKNKGNVLHRYLPLVVTLLMSLTIPAIALVNVMYPVAFAGLCIQKEE